MRSRRAILNFIFSFARNLVGTVLSLATTPFILSALGEERFGAFRILLDWLSHIGIFEFGLYSASLTLLSKATVEGPKNIHATIKLMFKNYFWVFLIQLSVFVLFVALINYLIPVSQELQRELRISALIFSFSLLCIISQIFKSYLEAVQKGYLVSLSLVIFNLFFILQCVLYAHWGWGLIGQALAYISSLIISLLLLLFFAPNVVKMLLTSTTEKSPHVLLKNQRFSHFINELCGRISMLSDNIIISLFMGAGTVTSFFITQRVGSMMQQQLQHLSNSSWAALSELHYQGKHQLFNQRVLNLTEIISFSAGTLLSVVCLLNPTFVSLWTGENTFAGTSVSNLTVINAGLFSLLSLWSWCFSATNLANKIITVSIVQGIVNIAASLFLTKKIGIAGPLYGTLIGYVFVSLFWKSHLLCKTFHISFKQLTLNWARPLLPPLATSMTFLFYYGPIQATSWFHLFFLATCLTIVFFVVSFFIFIGPESRALIKQTSKRFFMKKINLG